MTDTVYQWRIWCNTENAYVYGYYKDMPTVCPNDPTGHTVDSGQTTIVETINKKTVTIQEELVQTQGIYKFKGYKLAVPAGTPGDVTTFNITWPRPVTLLNGDFYATTDQVGDQIDAIAVGNVPIGAITAPVNPGDTVINVSPTVFDYVYNGYNVKLTDGVNTDELGECMVKDALLGTITVETPPTHAFSPASPTYVYTYVKVAETLHICIPIAYALARKKIGGKLLNQVTFRVLYTNNSGLAKDACFSLEYMY